MTKWPKTLPRLSAEQLRIKDDFMTYWHEILPTRYTALERFNHGYPAGRRPKSFIRTLEIGAGLGEQLAHEDLSNQEYYALEMRPAMAEKIGQRFPICHVVVGDCQGRLDFPDRFFDRVLAIHVLEHLPNLPAALREIHRLLKPSGHLCAVIPCEGGLAYGFARMVSTRRIFRKRYKQSFAWWIKSEHINLPDEIKEELRRFFQTEDISYFPLRVPSVNANLCIGMTLSPRSG